MGDQSNRDLAPLSVYAENDPISKRDPTGQSAIAGEAYTITVANIPFGDGDAGYF